jgi:hypothetical protein
MKDKKHMEEHNLDGLLNKLFLEENSENVNENLARFVMQQNYNVRIDANKEKELIHKLQNTSKGTGGFLNFLMIALALIISGAVFVLYKRYAPSETRSENKNANAVLKDKIKQNEAINTFSDTTSAYAISTQNTIHVSADKYAITEKENKKQVPSFDAKDVAVYFPKSGVGSKSNATFFKPNEQDILVYGIVKSKMLEKLLTADKELYTPMESGEITYRGNTIAIAPFTLRNKLITNLEYKVFLADLLKDGKSEEFKMAVVKNETWISYNDNILATTYFFDEKYNDFPIVNISSQAAQLFSEWLQKELNQYAKQQKFLLGNIKIRLPFDSECIYASKKGELELPECDGYTTIYDEKEGLVDDRYLKQTELIRIQRHSKRTILDDLFAINRYGMAEAEQFELFQRGFEYKDKTSMEALYPGKTTVFNKVAHVSEMVRERQTNNQLIVGSCWNSKQEFAKMVKEFRNAEASPFVGFRVVIVSDNKADP